jgi:hypothetical protein
MLRRAVTCSLFLIPAAVVLAWAAPAPPAPAKAESIAARLGKTIKFSGIDDPKATLREVLDLLTKRFDVPFDVNERAFKAEMLDDPAGAPIAERPIPPMDHARLDSVLRLILRRVNVPSGATFLVRRDHVEITTNAFVRPEVWGSYQGPFLPLVNVSFDREPLEAALKHLADETGYNIVLDVRAAEKGKTPVAARLANTPLDTAVRFLADMSDLRPVLLDNVIYVTTRENAALIEARLKKEKDAGADDPNEPPSGRRVGSGPGAVPVMPPGGM